MRTQLSSRAAVRTRTSVSGRAWQVGFLVAFALAGVLVGRVAVMLVHRSPTVDRPQAPPTAPAGESGVLTPPDRDTARAAMRAAAVLHRWDTDRAAAYARGDPAALRRLYAPGSRAGARDVRILRAYVERGLAVRGLRTQVLALRVVSHRPDRLSLEVTDRRAGGRIVGDGRPALSVALPRDAPSTRLVDLRRNDGRWRVASVVDG